MAKRKRIATSKPNEDHRDSRLVVYITDEDSAELFRIATMCGLSRSALVTSILERMIIGGFSPIVGAQLCLQIARRIEEQGYPSKGFYNPLRPLPSLPAEELSAADKTFILNNIKQQQPAKTPKVCIP